MEEEGEISKSLIEKQSPQLLARGHGNGGEGEEEGQKNDGCSSASTILVLSTMVAVSGSYVFGTAIGYSSPTQSGIMDDLSLSVAQLMGFAEAFCIIGWLAIAFAKVSWWLDAGRLLVGYGMGLLSYVVPVFIAEITPKNLRGAFTTVHQLMICFGVSFTYLIGSFVSWRILALIGTVPCIIQLLGLFFIPESPRWLAKIGRGKECEAALQLLRGKHSDISDEAAAIRDYTETVERLSESSSMFELFQWKYAHSLIVGVGLMVLQQFGGVNAIAFYASSIFVSAGFSGSVGTIAMVVVQVSAAGTGLGCFLVALSFLLQGLQVWTHISPLFALFGVLIYTGSFSLGMGGIPWVIMSEVFPINMKGSAGSLVTLISWLGSWIVSYAFNFLMVWSSSGTFFMFSGICGVTVVFVMKLVPETKGRTLEEIQASMNPFSGRRDRF
ncbi:unnamed protein product [Linum tenue]|uniref:Major facilitator superfamily (MFS) profile domain-containing protein n=1 Tax=Linum tenue TaxID=586396 RepID=A0AAV0R013_9ROSI|nr:unnamed protein product [Linum tenue]